MARIVPDSHMFRLTLAAVLAFVAAGVRADDDASAQPDSGAEAAAAARKVMAQALAGPAPEQPRSPAPLEPIDAETPATASATAAPLELAIARLSAEVAAKQLEAKRMAQKSPADALAALHEAGLAQGPFDLSSIVVDGDGRPLLEEPATADHRLPIERKAEA